MLVRACMCVLSFMIRCLFIAHKSQQLHNKAEQPICRATVWFLSLQLFCFSFSQRALESPGYWYPMLIRTCLCVLNFLMVILHKSQQLHNKAMQPICRATVCFLALFMFRSSFVDNFIIPVKYVKACSEIPPCDPSFQRVPWDAWVRRRQSVPRHVTQQGARDKVHLIKVTWLGT